MFHKVLIPLDGSKVAEESIEVLRQWLASGQIREALLVRVDRPTPEAVVDYVLPAEIVAASNGKKLDDARRYLDEVSRSIDWNGVAHRSLATLGEPTPTLAQLAEEERVDLVLTAVETRRGVHHLLRSSANRVLRAFSVPVLVLGEPPKASAAA